MAELPGDRAADVLDYPPGSLVLLTGLPGAGKSTLLDRLYGLRGDEDRPVRAGDALVIDSRQARQRWAALLPRLPRRMRSLVVHVSHVSRIAGATLRGHSVVAHSRAAWPHLLYGFAWLARLSGGRLHLILLDVAPETARAGQVARGRVVPETTFTRHCRRWHTILGRARGGALPPAAGVTLLDRAAADLLTAITFGPGGSGLEQGLQDRRARSPQGEYAQDGAGGAAALLLGDLQRGAGVQVVEQRVDRRALRRR